MPDDLERRAPEDPRTVNVNQPWELAWWSEQFNVSEERIKQAVAAVGPSVENVRKYLGLG